MRRDPALTYQGALQILGHHDRPRLEKLNKLLGGIILGSGAVAGAAALTGATALAPVAGIAALWGWVDQKNEAVSLVRKLLDGASDRLLKTGGHERHRLVAAAHTTIVVAAFFETLNEQLGADAGLGEARRRALASGEEGSGRFEDAITALYRAPVPVPSAIRGFEENTRHLRQWFVELTGPTREYFDQIGEPLSDRRLPDISTVDAAEERYRSHYLRLAATVPEFMVWAMLGEHAATRAQVDDVRGDVMTALDGQSRALARVEALLGLIAGEGLRPDRDLRAVVYRANRGGLDRPVISADTMRVGEELLLPTVGAAFINPRYRADVVNAVSRPADETWWDECEVGDDFDLFLAAHVTAPDAVCAPLLLLGHPGAGKSLLTKVLAARLPPSAYTVVRVPLRSVDADAPVYDQVQQALNDATHRRVDWWELADQSTSTIRVVLLDGLDELLQAAGDRSAYLQEVVDFQRREAEQDRPVVVVVTSRTVVADRVRIPPGTALVKLEDFDENQIAAWLDIWNSTNATGIQAGSVRPLPLESALAQRELAQQPLLLLMLALYSADPTLPELEADASKASLYQRLLENFTRREVDKTEQKKDVDEAVREELWQLGVAAFAMFNRGRQDVSDVELGADLAALAGDGPGTAVRVADLGQQVIGRFFFVHASEAQTHGVEGARQNYEFLHATFGEYLLASQVVELLAETAEAAFGGRRGPREPDDDLLFALLSHQPLSTRRPTLEFAAELSAEFGTAERNRILRLLETLVEGHRRRHGSNRYAGYRPMSVDRVRGAAAYSANLVLLRVLLDSATPVSLDRLWPDEPDPSTVWRSTVDLWKAGLDTDCWHSLLSTLTWREEKVRSERQRMRRELVDVFHARLVGDSDREARLRLGLAIHDRHVYEIIGSRWHDVMLSWLIPLLAATEGDIPEIYLWFPRDVPEEELRDVASKLAMLLKTKAHMFDHVLLAELVGFSLDLPPRNWDSDALAAAIASHPGLLDQFTGRLWDPALYDNAPGAALILRAASPEDPKDREALELLCSRIEERQGTRWSDTFDEKSDEAIRALICAHRW
ncbi:NACHT domain-containing protein [Actinomadura rugatobispora]|uniref:NACHT domain-containing protein n=1 Tax=Actinomadura rugatobispora TaxID=1994 RepID=A0ABW1A0R1_9ACTN|nr:hypothetical protein GCM10010200_008060 [Actinomadura rugatobispora]